MSKYRDIPQYPNLTAVDLHRLAQFFRNLLGVKPPSNEMDYLLYEQKAKVCERVFLNTFKRSSLNLKNTLNENNSRISSDLRSKSKNYEKLTKNSSLPEMQKSISSLKHKYHSLQRQCDMLGRQNEKLFQLIKSNINCEQLPSDMKFKLDSVYQPSYYASSPKISSRHSESYHYNNHHDGDRGDRSRKMKKDLTNKQISFDEFGRIKPRRRDTTPITQVLKLKQEREMQMTNTKLKRKITDLNQKFMETVKSTTNSNKLNDRKKQSKSKIKPKPNTPVKKCIIDAHKLLKSTNSEPIISRISRYIN